ncbi:MAG: MarR family transcriptional regulator [Holdemanella sp.]|nr:MarR family transcriptional regulator [Holdemanella sp.]
MNTRFELFAGNVLELNRCLQKIKDFEMKQYGLRANHVMVMRYLGSNEEGLTSSELTTLCKEDKAAVSRTVSQLIENGLIYHNKNEKTYRSKLFLSESGKQIYERINERVDAILALGGSGLTEEEKQVFFYSMEVILTNLKNYLQEFDN